MKKAASRTSRLTRKSLFVVLSVLLSVISAQGQAILSGDRSVPVEAKNGMVVTSHTLATEVALAVLKKGGNAIDAAVTAGFAGGHPAPIGKYRRWRLHADLIEEKHEVVAIDYREKAPTGASRDMFQGPREMSIKRSQIFPPFSVFFRDRGPAWPSHWKNTAPSLWPIR